MFWDRTGLGFTDLISLAPADTLSDVFAWVCRRSTLGDRVWHDLNFNGIQEAGENGIAGVGVFFVGQFQYRAGSDPNQ